MTEYDEHRDIAESVREGFRVVFARVAAGGPGIFGYGPSDRFWPDEKIREWQRKFLNEQT